jgi:hypothetical protein
MIKYGFEFAVGTIAAYFVLIAAPIYFRRPEGNSEEQTRRLA